MPKYKPLKYREVITIMRNLGFNPPVQSTGGSHETWTLKKEGAYYAVTVFFHGSNLEFKDGTLRSIIRQSGFSKEEFYDALKKK